MSTVLQPFGETAVSFSSRQNRREKRRDDRRDETEDRREDRRRKRRRISTPARRAGHKTNSGTSALPIGEADVCCDALTEGFS